MYFCLILFSYLFSALIFKLYAICSRFLIIALMSPKTFPECFFTWNFDGFLQFLSSLIPNVLRIPYCNFFFRTFTLFGSQPRNLWKAFIFSSFVLSGPTSSLLTGTGFLTTYCETYDYTSDLT